MNGYVASRGVYAYCYHCTKTWTNEELIQDFLTNKINVQGLTEFPEGRSRQLKAMAISYQKDTSGNIMERSILNAA